MTIAARTSRLTSRIPLLFLLGLAFSAVEAKAGIRFADPTAPRHVLAQVDDTSPVHVQQEARLRCLPFCTQVGSQGRARVRDHRPPPHQGRPPRPPLRR